MNWTSLRVSLTTSRVAMKAIGVGLLSLKAPVRIWSFAPGMSFTPVTGGTAASM